MNMREIPECTEDIKKILNEIENTEEVNGETLCSINELVDEILSIYWFKKQSTKNESETLKAVLVMDMPESCSKCKFMYEFQGIKKCQLMNMLNNGASKLSQSTYTKRRHGLCPLRDLPDKNPNNPELAHGVYYTEKGYEVYKNGWNACREKFLQPDG